MKCKKKIIKTKTTKTNLPRIILISNTQRRHLKIKQRIKLIPQNYKQNPKPKLTQGNHILISNTQ